MTYLKLKCNKVLEFNFVLKIFMRGGEESFFCSFFCMI